MWPAPRHLWVDVDLLADIGSRLWHDLAMTGGVEQSIGPVAHVPVYGIVVEHLRRAIHLGTFVAGDKLPPERELAKQLTVSRTTVREAIRVLEGEGYVEIHRGATGGVRVLHREHNMERLIGLVRSRLGELEQIVDFLLAVECSAARLAATRRSEKDLERLADAFRVMDDGWEGRGLLSSDFAFHLGIADAAGNRWMRDAIENARVAIWVPLEVVTDELHSAQLHHARVLAAIRDQDPDAAERAVAEHIESTRADLRKMAASRT
jgi:DNA-binding FadR family transcriptional regulator